MDVQQARLVYKANIKEINSIKDLPQEVQEKLLNLIDSNVLELHLLGSYAEGHWCDKNSSEDFKMARKIIRNRTKYSDIDIFIKPYRQIEGFDVIPVLSGKSILIYKKDDSN